MRAVNLIPHEERGLAPGQSAGRSGGLVYAFLALPLVCLVVATAWTLGARGNADTRADLAQTAGQAGQAEAEAASLQRYVDLAGVRQQRAETVGQLAADRFDWPRTLRELARVAPKDLVITGLQGTVSPDAASKGGSGGDTSGLRDALPLPALELSGCAADQDHVAAALRSLRDMEGATRVSLKDTARNEEAAAGSASGGAVPVQSSGGDADCRRGSTRMPAFSAVVFFDPAAGKIAPGRPSAQDVQEAGA